MNRNVKEEASTKNNRAEFGNNSDLKEAASNEKFMSNLQIIVNGQDSSFEEARYDNWKKRAERKKFNDKLEINEKTNFANLIEEEVLESKSTILFELLKNNTTFELSFNPKNFLNAIKTTLASKIGELKDEKFYLLPSRFEFLFPSETLAYHLFNMQVYILTKDVWLKRQGFQSMIVFDSTKTIPIISNYSYLKKQSLSPSYLHDKLYFILKQAVLVGPVLILYRDLIRCEQMALELRKCIQFAKLKIVSNISKNRNYNGDLNILISTPNKFCNFFNKKRIPDSSKPKSLIVDNIELFFEKDCKPLRKQIILLRKRLNSITSTALLCPEKPDKLCEEQTKQFSLELCDTTFGTVAHVCKANTIDTSDIKFDQ